MASGAAEHHWNIASNLLAEIATSSWRATRRYRAREFNPYAERQVEEVTDVRLVEMDQFIIAFEAMTNGPGR